jgi:hypothetical protein
MACVRFSLLEAVSGGPSTATNGFAATCRIVIPLARIKSAARKNPYEIIILAGKNNNAPSPVMLNPITIPFLYPILEMIIPAGIEEIK